MPRRYQPSKRPVEPDQKYNSQHIAMCINRVMLHGKKSTARAIVYGALEIVAEKTNRDPVEIFEQGLKNATPLIEVKPRRVGGATYQIPVEISTERKIALALRWLIGASRSRSGKSMAEKLASELMDAANNVGASVKRREDTHRMAEANKAYAHYRW
ncbi:MAG: 30S ribosomal protein S7 [Anaerolineae bacterium]|nr:30S ribosomal protein S7 [Anaerolineae bacterium]